MTYQHPVTPSESPYTLRRKIRNVVTDLPWRIFQRLGIPGVVQDLDFPDPLTGDRLRVRTLGRYTVISVSGRDYWFSRVSGRFDGTGMGCAPPVTPEDAVRRMLDDTHGPTNPPSR